MNAAKKSLASVLLTAISPLVSAVVEPELDYLKNSQMDEVIVSASPLVKNQNNTSRPATVLSGDKLRTQAAATLGETLQGELGVDVASFGPGVGAVVIRGQQGNRVKVMQDSLGAGDASGNSSDHANVTEALLADRIEVLRGPQTLRYGSGAIGGIINVIDSRIPEQLPEKTGTQAAVETRYNSVNGETSSFFRLDGNVESWNWHLDGLHRDSNNVSINGPANIEDGEATTRGYIANTSSQASGGTLGGSWIGDNGFFGMSVNFLERNYGIPPNFEESAEDAAEEELIRIDMKQTRYDLKGGLEQAFTGIKTLSYQVGYVDYEHVELENGETGTMFDSNSTEARVEAVHREIAGWQGAFGMQASLKDFAAIGEEAFIPQSDTRSVGFFVMEERQIKRFLIELGARVEHQSIEPETGNNTEHNSISLSFATGYRLSERQHVNLVLSRSQRAPSVEELYSNGAHFATKSIEVGDENLDQETSQNLELGYRYRGQGTTSRDGLSVDINLFYNAIGDFIYRRNTARIDVGEGLDIYQYSQEDTLFKGLEAQALIPIGSQYTVRLFTDRVRAELDSQGNVPRVTPPRIGAELQFENDNWSAHLRWTDVDKQKHPGNFEEQTKGYTRLDAQLNYRLHWAHKEMLVFLKGQNLSDEKIRSASSFLRDLAPEPGRGITAGVRLNF